MTTTPRTAAATSELNAVFLVVAAAFFGPVAAYAVARLLAPALAALSPVGGFLASANLGATTRQVRSMARWEALLIIAIGLGIGLAIAATALLPLSHAFTGGLRPYAPAGWFGAILGVSAVLALVALSLPTWQVLRTRPVEAIGIRE